MPRVSVLMPLYKTNATHLREAVGSVLAQTYTDFELLLLDDCPNDDRAAVVAEFSDPRIRYEKNEKNLGISRSRNKLIDMAQGEYLAIMDHDDISLPNRLENQVRYMDIHPEVGVVSGRIQILGSDRISRYPENDADIRLSLMSGCALVHTASMVRKSVLDAHGIRYEERYSPCEDYALWCALMPHTRFHNLPEVTCFYRDLSTNTTHNQAALMKARRNAIWARVRTENPELYSEFLLSSKQVVRVKLFGVIPLLKLVTCSDRQKCYLFDFILLYQKRTDVKFENM